MTSGVQDRDRRGQLVLVVLGALANVIAVVQFAGSHLPVLIVGVLILWVLLYVYGPALLGFLRRHRRDLFFLVLGGALATSGIEGHRLWKPDAPLPENRPAPLTPPPSIETNTPALELESAVPSEIVYRTPSGKRYHRADCSYVKGKAIPVSLEDAKESGLTPCKVCRPPALR